MEQGRKLGVDNKRRLGSGWKVFRRQYKFVRLTTRIWHPVAVDNSIPYFGDEGAFQGNIVSLRKIGRDVRVQRMKASLPKLNALFESLRDGWRKISNDCPFSKILDIPKNRIFERAPFDQYPSQLFC